MKKIFYIANLRLPTERAHSIQIVKMCEAFALQGAEVELIIPDKRNNLGEVEIFEYYGVGKTFKITKIPSLDLLGKTRLFGKLFYWMDLFSFLLSLSFNAPVGKEDTVYTRDPLLLLPFIWNKENYLWTEIHDIPQRNFLFRQLLKRMNGVVVITGHLKRILTEKGLEAGKFVVAPDAINLKDFAQPISQKEARENLGLSRNKKIAMYIGLLDKWKGYKTLLEASEFLPEEFQMVVIGGTAEQLCSLRSRYPKAVFLGFKPYKELARHQRAADVLVIPNSGKAMISKYFTSPLKLFAHMASGVPMVVSELPSLREIVDESSTYFFSPDDAKSLAQAIKNVLANPEEAQKRSVQARMESEKYSWENRARTIVCSIFRNKIK